MSVQRFRQNPVDVDAIQFKGWGNFEEVQRFAPGVYYVPAGADHSLRRENERDRSNGNFYEDQAREFLVVPMSGGDVLAVRADYWDWIVRSDDGQLSVCEPDIFNATYQLVAEADV